MKVLGVFTELKNDGGVQRMGRHMALVLKTFCRENGHDFQIISFADANGPGEFSLFGELVEFRGFGGGKFHFQRFLLACDADAAYVNHAFISPAVYALKIIRPRFRYAVHMHGVEAWEPLSLSRRMALRHAALVTVTSRYTGEEAVRNEGIKPDRIRLLYPAVEPVASASDRSPLIDSSPFLLTVARMSKTDAPKRVDLAIEAFSKVAPEFPDWKYIIVGSGEDSARLRQLAERGLAKDRIIFTGRVSDEELSSLYEQCSLFVLPSFKEGLGIVFLEAMARSRPVIGANFGGIPEVITHGRNGFLLDSESAERLAELLKSMMKNSCLCEQMGAKSKIVVREKFSFPSFDLALRNVCLEFLL